MERSALIVDYYLFFYRFFFAIDVDEFIDNLLRSDRSAADSGVHFFLSVETHLFGNALEVAEVIGILQGNEENALSELALELSAQMLELSGKGDLQTCRKLASEALHSGKALEKFSAMIAAQGGDASVTEHPERLPKSGTERAFRAELSGYIAVY